MGRHYILLYGTLMSSEGGYASHGLSRVLTPMGERTIDGVLYDLGGYPGIVLGGGQVIGELYRIDDPEILAWLDAYEEYDPRNPAKSLYLRRSVQVERHRNPFIQALTGFPMLDAWIYAYNGSVDGLKPIEAASWREYRDNKTRI